MTLSPRAPILYLIIEKYALPWRIVFKAEEEGTMKLYRNTTSYTARRRSRRGFTLVELIVVLTIIAILAAIGITSVVGYINRSRFDQNNQNAITIYQAAQTAVTQKINNGSMQEWVIRIPGVDVNTDSELTIPTDAETNYSTHKKLALTYNPTSDNTDQKAYLQTFLSPYFYDKAIFQVTITVVFLLKKATLCGCFFI